MGTREDITQIFTFPGTSFKSDLSVLRLDRVLSLLQLLGLHLFPELLLKLLLS